MKSHKQQGILAVEMAVILLPMLILCFGITEVGRALYLYNGLVKATRGAARYLAMQDLASPPAGKTADALRNEAIFLALCGRKTCSDTDEPLVPGMTLSQISRISVCDPFSCVASHGNVPTGQGSVNLVSVTIGATTVPGAYTHNGASPTAYEFISIIPWVIPHISFAPVTTTMSSQFL